MTTEYTNNFRFNLPDFRMGPWHDLVNTNTVRIDQLLMSIYQGVDTSPWQNNYDYVAGVTAVDNADNSFWVCVVTHTSAPAPTTFAEDRLAHPTYWNRVVVGIAPRGPWLNDTHYLVNDMVSDASQGVIAVCITEHVSSPDPATIRDDAPYWTFIVDMTGTDALDASLVAYDDSTGYTGAGDVDVALDYLASVSHTLEDQVASIGPVVIEHETRLDTAESEIDVAQAQLADHDSRISSNTAAIGTHTTQIAAITASDTAQNARLTAIEGAGYVNDAPADGNKYARKDHAWIPIDTAAVLVSDTPPAGAPDNALWWESDTGQLYIRFNDGDSVQWVVAVPQLDAGSFVAKGGDTMTGPLIQAPASAWTAAQQQNNRQAIYAAPFDAMAYSGMQVNGSVDVSQRWGTGLVSLVTGNVMKVADAWCAFYIHSATGLFAAQISSGSFSTLPVNGFPNLLYMTTTTTGLTTLANGQQAQFRHPIEGYRWARMGFGLGTAQSFSYAFWFYAQVAGFIGVRWMNGGGNRSYMQEKAVAFGWNYVTGTVPGDMTGTWAIDTAIGMYLDVFVAGKQAAVPTMNAWWAGADNTTPNLTNQLAAANAPVGITGLVIVPGIEVPSSSRSPYIMRSFDQELPICMRYFEMWSQAGGSGYNLAAVGAAVTTSQVTASLPFKVRKRIAPVFQYSANADFTVLFNGFGSTSAVTNITMPSYGVDGVTIQATATGTPLTVGQVAAIAATNGNLNGRLYFDSGFI